LTSFILTGDAGYVEFQTESSEFDALEVIDFSGFGGDTYVELDSTADVTITGGAGDNYFDFDSGFDENDSFDGRGGDDTLEVDVNEAVAVSDNNVVNVEHLRLTGYLDGDLVLNNSAGFEDVALQDDTTNDGGPGGNNLVLSGFETVIIEDDQYGVLSIDGVNEVDIIIDSPYDSSHYIDTLEVGEVTDVYLYFADEGYTQDTYIDELDIETDVVDTDTLTIAGEGSFFVDNVTQDNGDPLQLVDASNFTGGMFWDDFAGQGTDWLIGDLEEGYSSRIENSYYDGEEAEFVLSGTNNDWYLYIEDFQATGGGSLDTLDLGLLGVDDLSDIQIVAVGNDWQITANADQFEGTILLDTSGTSLAEIQVRIEFDGGLN
jgi:hypothetical protein